MSKEDHKFSHPVLEMMHEKMERYRQELMRQMCYVSTDRINVIAESRGMLIGYDNVKKGIIELDQELSKQDEAK